MSIRGAWLWGLEGTGHVAPCLLLTLSVVAGWEGTSSVWSLPLYLGECLLTIIPVLTFLPPDSGSWTAGPTPILLFPGSVAGAGMPKALTLTVTGWWGRGNLLVFFPSLRSSYRLS